MLMLLIGVEALYVQILNYCSTVQVAARTQNTLTENMTTYEAGLLDSSSSTSSPSSYFTRGKGQPVYQGFARRMQDAVSKASSQRSEHHSHRVTGHSTGSSAAVQSTSNIKDCASHPKEPRCDYTPHRFRWSNPTTLSNHIIHST